MNPVRLLLRLGLFSVLLLGTANSFSAEDTSNVQVLFQQANEKYQQKDYSEAVNLYEKSLASGFDSAALYYNLGNAYFKQGQIGRAIANYLRARRLDPRNPEIEWNLRYARSLQVDREYQITQSSFTGKLFAGLRDKLALNELVLVSVVLFWLLCLCLAGRFWKPGAAPIRIGMWIFLALYLFVAGLTVSKYLDISQTQAVIIEPAVTVTSGPDTGTPLFTLHEGLAATVKRHHGTWIQIRLPNGLTGWVEDRQVEYL